MNTTALIFIMLLLYVAVIAALTFGVVKGIAIAAAVFLMTPPVKFK